MQQKNVQWAPPTLLKPSQYTFDLRTTPQCYTIQRESPEFVLQASDSRQRNILLQSSQLVKQRKMLRVQIITVILVFVCAIRARPYDPNDVELSSVLPPAGTFEAFYPRDSETGSSRAAHSHGSFFKHRNPALVDAKNAAAYGFRFDGGRRFNYE